MYKEKERPRYQKSELGARKAVTKKLKMQNLMFFWPCVIV